MLCKLIFQAKAAKDLKEVTHKVFFDVEIDGKAAGMSKIVKVTTFVTFIYITSVFEVRYFF